MNILDIINNLLGSASYFMSQSESQEVKDLSKFFAQRKRQYVQGKISRVDVLEAVAYAKDTLFLYDYKNQSIGRLQEIEEMLGA